MASRESGTEPRPSARSLPIGVASATDVTEKDLARKVTKERERPAVHAANDGIRPFSVSPRRGSREASRAIDGRPDGQTQVLRQMDTRRLLPKLIPQSVAFRGATV